MILLEDARKGLAGADREEAAAAAGASEKNEGQ